MVATLDTNNHGLEGNESGSDFFAHHMVNILKDLGFSTESHSTVEDRVKRNTITAGSRKRAILIPEPQSVLKVVNNEILDKDVLAAKGIQLNSNEPILLLEVASAAEAGPEEIQSTKSTILTALRAKGIQPVRVYVRDCTSSSAPELTISLLNVVNTDIGGPSMTQLLDAAFHDVSWKQKLILKEAYHGHNLLWFDTAWNTHNGADTPASMTVAEPAETTNAGRIDDTPGKLESASVAVADVSEDVPIAAKPAQHRDLNEPTSDAGEDLPDPIEHPSMKELRERDQSRPGIVHPSWSREDEKHGLLDIITTQSSQTEKQPLSVISGGTTNTDDDFEVVEKT